MATKKKNIKRGEPAIPASLNTPEFTAAWAEWLQFTSERGIPLGDDDAVRQLKLLAKLGPEMAIADIRKTMDAHPLKERVPDQVAKKGKGAKAETKTLADQAASPGAEGTVGKTKGKKAKPVKEPKAKKMSTLDAAAKVLEEKGAAMNCQEMIDAMAAAGYWRSPGGLTPAATLYSAILRETDKKGSGSRFRKAERGKFVRA